MLSNVKEYCIGFTMGPKNSIIMSSIKTKKGKEGKMEIWCFLGALLGVILLGYGFSNKFFSNKEIGDILLYAGGAILLFFLFLAADLNAFLFTIIMGSYIIYGGQKIVKKICES